MSSLITLLIIWGGVYIANILADKTRLTPVLFFLFFGVLMVNLGVLPQEPDEFITIFAEIGIIIIMFAVGFEENSSRFVQSIKRSWGIALFGAIAPFAVAYGLADYFWDNSKTSLMCGLTMMATAVSLTMVSLKEEGLGRTQAATGIMTSAVLDDIASLILVAIMVPVATGAGDITFISIGTIIGKVVIFFICILLLGFFLLPHQINSKLKYFPLLGRYGLRDILQLNDGKNATLVILMLAVSVGITAHYFGFHPAVGAYMAGLVVKEEFFLFSNSKDKGENYQKMHETISNMAFSWIGPVFFVNLGTKLIFDLDIFISLLPETIILFTAILFSQIASAALAARYTASFDWANSFLIGFGMLGRAELAFVVIDIAYVQNKLLTDEAFYTLMFTIFWLNISVPISIKLWKWYNRNNPVIQNQVSKN